MSLLDEGTTPSSGFARQLRRAEPISRGPEPEIACRVDILPYAVGPRNETGRFCAKGPVGARASGIRGKLGKWAIRPSTGPLAETAPTLIKMDIEGAEPEALRGAARTMPRRRPAMAVCAYHKCAHLWETPRMLKAANPEYEIFPRRYAEDCRETVYCAIPPERLAIGEEAARA